MSIWNIELTGERDLVLKGVIARRQVNSKTCSREEFYNAILYTRRPANREARSLVTIGTKTSLLAHAVGVTDNRV